jgi:hypothetical protein
MGKTQITAEPGIPLITVTRDFDAPRDLVFRALRTPNCWCNGLARASSP